MFALNFSPDNPYCAGKSLSELLPALSGNLQLFSLVQARK